MSIKDKIKSKAIEMFNENDYFNVTLADIAYQLGMSRGNLSYHYTNKEDLLKVILNDLWISLENKSSLFPSFENLHQNLLYINKLQNDYAFLFLDYYVMNLPFIRDKIKDMFSSTIKLNKSVIAFSIKLGNMKNEPSQGIYNTLAFSIAIMAHFWIMRGKLIGEKDSLDLEKSIWGFLLPHFTEKGKNSFIKFFGEDYYNNIGESFDKGIIDDMI